jgi:hypothetical protein
MRSMVAVLAEHAATRPGIGFFLMPEQVAELAALLVEPQLAQPVDEDDLFTETWQQEVMRRLSAVESNAAELGELRNMINQHEGDLRKVWTEVRGLWTELGKGK